jgi:exopolyphosphatase / guanosine-5'-triphosphate,3'-diphosphate pyrophosphatase
MGFNRALQDIKMRIAAIDIGTNTLLMVIADVSTARNLTIIRDEHFIGRLGKGVDRQGIIQNETFGRVHDILLQLKNIADSEKVEKIIAAGTSALRDAKNRPEFLDFIRDRLAISIKVLPGKEEARLTYIGAVSEYLHENKSVDFAVIDIGGGSTELVIGTGQNVISANSIDIGSVRLTERILKTSPPFQKNIEKAIDYVRAKLEPLPRIPSNTRLIGVAGTLTTLASIDLRLKEFDRNAVNRYALNSGAVDRIFRELAPLTLDQIKSYPQIHPDRADIILAGIIILREILSKSGLQSITVSDRGLRYGLLHDYLNNPSNY